jgi:hypothetical protein
MRTVLTYMAILTVLVTGASSCGPGRYSFTGASIPADVKTFSVDLFQNQTPNGPIYLPKNFTEKLIRKIQQEGNLRYVASDGDLIFKGNIVGYTFSNQAAVAGTTTALNQLTIQVNVSYENTKDAEDKWEQVFTKFDQASATENLTTAEPRLIDNISTLLVDDIFQKAFIKW